MADLSSESQLSELDDEDFTDTEASSQSNLPSRNNLDLDSLPYGVRGLRRPKTTDQSQFYYVSPDLWRELCAKSMDDSPSTKKNAMNTLRKFDAAGRMMETSEGELAGQPCSWCTRPGFEVDCRVYKGRKEKGCAYCRRHGKGGCFAGDPSQAPPPSLGQRLDDVERQLESITVSHASLEASVSALLQRLDVVELPPSMLENNIAQFRSDAARAWTLNNARHDAAAPSSAQLSSIEDHVRSMEVQLETVVRRQTSQAALRHTNDQAEAQIAAIGEQVQAMQIRLDMVEGTTRVLQDGTRHPTDDSRAPIASLEKRIRALQVHNTATQTLRETWEVAIEQRLDAIEDTMTRWRDATTASIEKKTEDAMMSRLDALTVRVEQRLKTMEDATVQWIDTMADPIEQRLASLEAQRTERRPTHTSSGATDYETSQQREKTKRRRHA